ncbi:serine hydrolase domain-containing protein [Ekhidna sp.]|uniref:serine hydrolase domain-containing protein n=1 Tax=Ekhidna sp. TaxID=2608089 RepID=UPI003B5128B3
MKSDILQTVFLTFIAILIFSCSKKNTLSVLEIPDPDELDDVLNYFVDEDFYPFIYARIEDADGNLIYEHSAVNDRLLPNTTIDGDTWIRIWSMSKIVTISVALDLVEDGVIKLDDPVSKYIPEFQNLNVAVSNEGNSLAEYDWGNRDQACPIQLVPNDSIMTVLHLINHEAGFYYATTGYPCLDSLIAAQNLPTAKNSDELIDRMSKLPLIQHSGTDYFYGTNTTVLGLVAERATGKDLSQLVEDRVTNPLKIAGLQYRIPTNAKLLPKFTGRDSILREANNGELDIFGPDVPDYELDHPLYLGGEGMVATADGYADFVRMLLKRGELNGYRFLEKETVEDIYAPHTQLDNPYGYNGYNLWISGDTMRVMNQGEAGLWIGGGYECTYFWADPKRNFVGIVMSQNNEVRPPGYELNDKFRGTLYKQLWESEKK